MIRAVALWLLPLALLAPSMLLAQAASEAAVKAAFVTKFGAYVGWPANTGPITICAVGNDVMGRVLDRAVAGQQVDGRPLVLRRMDVIEPGSGCAIALLFGSARQSIEAALIALRAEPVLTVTDNRWSRAHGMVHFQTVDNRVRFRIDDRSAAQSGLSISSKLLALAMSVQPRGGGAVR